MVKIEDYAAAREIISSEIDAFNEQNEKFEATWDYLENKQVGCFIIDIVHRDLSLHVDLLKYMYDFGQFDRSVLKKDLKDLKGQLMYRVDMTLAYKALGLYVPQEIKRLRRI